jgi:hypothetical protein
MVDKQFELASARWVVENSVEQVVSEALERAYALEDIISTLYYTHWPDPQLTYKYTHGCVNSCGKWGWGNVPPSVKIGVLKSIYVEGDVQRTHENSRVTLETALKGKQNEPA